MAKFKPDPDSLCSLDYTPRFYCQVCGADVPAVCLSERKDRGGILREIECPACRCQERVRIRVSEDCSGWLLFEPEPPDLGLALKCAPPEDSDV
jgi:hypothetical protein